MWGNAVLTLAWANQRNIDSGLPPGLADVVVVVHPLSPARSDAHHRPRAHTGLFLEKPARDVDVDAAVDEMNAEWKRKLEDLPT
jgi:hypothetical protein